MKFKNIYFLVGTLCLGIMLCAAGAFMLFAGAHTYGELREELAKERLEVQDPNILLTYPDARAPEGVEVPKVLIDTAREAEAQAEVIQTHVLALTGGKTYSELARDDPNRATYLNAVTLRTALHQAHIGFEVTMFVLGMGAILAALGVAVLALGLPLVRMNAKK